MERLLFRFKAALLKYEDIQFNAYFFYDFSITGSKENRKTYRRSGY